MLEGKIKRREADDLYFEDILEMNEALDVWADMNDLDKSPPAQPTSPDGVIRMSRNAFYGLGGG